MSLPIRVESSCRSGRQVDASQSVRDSDSLHDDGWIGQRGQCLEILRVLGEHDPSGSLGDCNDDCIDGRAARRLALLRVRGARSVHEKGTAAAEPDVTTQPGDAAASAASSSDWRPARSS